MVLNSSEILLAYTDHRYDDGYIQDLALVYLIVAIIFGVIFIGGCIAWCIKGGPIVIPGIIHSANMPQQPGYSVVGFHNPMSDPPKYQ